MNISRQGLSAMIAIFLLAPQFASADGGFYVGASVGSAALNEDFDGLTIDADATAIRIVAGWRFSEYFSVEGGYHDFGNFEQSIDNNGTLDTVSLSADGLILGVSGGLPVSEKLSLTGRIGWFFWDGNAEVNAVSQANPKDTNLFFGGGASYKLTDRFSVNADWSRYDLDGAQGNVLSAGFQYSF